MFEKVDLISKQNTDRNFGDTTTKIFSGMSKHFLETHRFAFFYFWSHFEKNRFFMKVMSQNS